MIKSAKFSVLVSVHFVNLVFLALTPLARGDSGGIPTALNRCATCHSGAQSPAGLNFDRGVDGLVEASHLRPGDPAGSSIFQAVENGSMPPGSMPKLNAVEVASVRQWIQDLRPKAKSLSEENPEQIAMALASGWRDGTVRSDDLVVVVSKAMLLSSKLQDLAVMKTALIKAVNSATRAPKVVLPRTLAGYPQVLLFSISHLRWENVSLLSKFARDHRHTSDLVRGIRKALGRPEVYGEFGEATSPRVWDAASVLWAVTEPDIYMQLLYPSFYETNPSLYSFLNTVVGPVYESFHYPQLIAGFLKSNVAVNQRTTYRLESPSGYLWGSGDFAFGKEGRDLRTSLYHTPDGGEFVVRLPNGLQLYLISNAEGKLLLEAPKSIVRDPRRSDEIIRSPTSCFLCHGNVGVIPRAASEAIDWTYGEGPRGRLNAAIEEFMSRDSESYMRLLKEYSLNSPAGASASQESITAARSNVSFSPKRSVQEVQTKKVTEGELK